MHACAEFDGWLACCWAKVVCMHLTETGSLSCMYALYSTEMNGAELCLLHAWQYLMHDMALVHTSSSCISLLTEDQL